MFATPAADEIFSGDSQPQPLRPPCSQTKTSQPNNPPRRKKLTPKKKKIPPTQSTQQQPRQLIQPKEQTRLKPKEWRVPRSTAVKFGLDVGKKTAAGRHINTRGKKTQRVVEEIDVESDAWPSDDSEDGDYEASDVEVDSDMELDSENDCERRR